MEFQLFHPRRSTAAITLTFASLLRSPEKGRGGGGRLCLAGTQPRPRLAAACFYQDPRLIAYILALSFFLCKKDNSSHEYIVACSPTKAKQS